MPVLSSSFCRGKNPNCTIDIELEATANPDMPPVLQSTGRCSRKQVLFWGFRMFAAALLKSPKLPLRAFLFIFPY
jgi:hypothetical protein